MSVDETIQVCCSRCKGRFRDKARRVMDGYSRQCPGCERMLFFTEGSANHDINRALRDAKRVRKLLLEEMEEKILNKAKSDQALDISEEAHAVVQRTERRKHSAGRVSYSRSG